MDLYLNCSECGQKLVVDSSAGGEAVQCPTCNQKICIPKLALSKSISSRSLIWGVIIIVFVSALVTFLLGQRNRTTTANSQVEPQKRDEDFIGLIQPLETNSAGQVMIGHYPFAGSVEVSFDGYLDRHDFLQRPQDYHTVYSYTAQYGNLAPIVIVGTNNPIVMQWTFRNNTSYYISCGVIDMNLKNSWGNPIGTASIPINSFKPYEARKVFGTASNVFAEDIYSWELREPILSEISL